MCCGQTARSVTPSLLSSAVPGQAGQWEITYPSGNSRKFPTEWQAEASRAVGGGTIEFIPATVPQVEQVEDVAPTEDVTAAAVTSSTSTSTPADVEPAAAPPAPKPTPPRKTAAAKPAPRTRKAPATPRKPAAKPSTD